MKCPKCGSATTVTNSRTLESRGEEYLKTRADKAVGWYTQDWRIRIRRCKDPTCTNSRLETIELLVSDIKEMLRDGHHED